MQVGLVGGAARPRLRAAFCPSTRRWAAWSKRTGFTARFGGGRAAPGTGTTGACGSIRPRRRVGRPGSDRGCRRSGPRPRTPRGRPGRRSDVGGRATRPSARSGPPTSELAQSFPDPETIARLQTCGKTAPSKSAGDTPRTARAITGDRRTCTQAMFSPRPHTGAAEPEPETGHDAVPMLLPGGILHDRVGRRRSPDQRHGRVRDHPKPGHTGDTEPGHGHTSHPAGSLRAYDLPGGRIVTVFVSSAQRAGRGRGRAGTIGCSVMGFLVTPQRGR